MSLPSWQGVEEGFLERCRATRDARTIGDLENVVRARNGQINMLIDQVQLLQYEKEGLRRDIEALKNSGPLPRNAHILLTIEQKNVELQDENQALKKECIQFKRSLDELGAAHSTVVFEKTELDRMNEKLRNYAYRLQDEVAQLVRDGYKLHIEKQAADARIRELEALVDELKLGRS